MAGTWGPGDRWVGMRVYMHEGIECMQDPNTGIVYEPMGRLVNGVLQKKESSRKIFAAIAEYLTTHKKKPHEVFDFFDDNKDGELQTDEVRNVLKSVMGEVSEAEALHFQAMIDTNGDGVISREEFDKALKECVEVETAQESVDGKKMLHGVLSNLRQYATEHGSKGSLLKVFKELDTDSSGFLDQQELLQMITKMVPEATPSEKRAALSVFFESDLNSDGNFSYWEFTRAIRLEASLAAQHEDEPASKRSKA